MKFKNSLAFRLIVYIFLIMSAANFLAGAWYLFLSRRTGIVPDRWFELFRSDFRHAFVHASVPDAGSAH